MLLLSSIDIPSGLSKLSPIDWDFLRPVNIDFGSSSIQTAVSSVGPIFFLINPWKPTLLVPTPPDTVTTTTSPLPLQ